MESISPEVSSALLGDLYLLNRGAALEQVDKLFDGKLTELCIQTRHPKQLAPFIAACLARRGELETGAGARCYFIRDRETWEEMCSVNQPGGQILVAEPELDFAGMRGELLPSARQRAHSVIYSLANPRPDTADLVVLGEPKDYEVREVLERHGFTRQQAEKMAKQSNGNVYLLTRLLTGTAARPAWLTGASDYPLRSLALLGSWDEASVADQGAVAKIVDEPYETWASRIYPLARQNDPPLVLEGRIFRPVSRYENWQLLCPLLTDADLQRFANVAKEVLGQDESEEDLKGESFLLPKEEAPPPRYSEGLRKEIAETLALLAAQGGSLQCSPNLSKSLVDDVVRTLLDGQDWMRWASISRILPRLAEASPTCFLSALERGLADSGKGTIRRFFVERPDWLFGRNYHPHFLWALETLAWSQEYLTRVCLILTQLAEFRQPENLGNRPLDTLASIFLPWLPQTLAPIEARHAVVECVIGEDSETGWQLLLKLLPKRHQIGSYNAKPVWRDWIPTDWRERVTRAERFKQVLMYSELAVELALEDASKMEHLFDRWEYLPPQASRKLLEFLKSDSALQLPEEQRYTLWEKLSSQVRRHRKYAYTDWALPAAEVLRLDEAAAAIKPVDPLFARRWLFNAYDHDLFETDDYQAEGERIAVLREDAVREVLALHGAGGLTGIATGVSQPGQLGSAAARTAGTQLDAEYLPRLLSEPDGKLAQFIRGYVRQRYHLESAVWISGLGVGAWELAMRVRFFSYLPFQTTVWQLAEKELGESVADYWNAISPNVFEAEGDLLEGAQKALENGRPEIAVDCVHAMLFNKAEVPVEVATSALEAFLRAGISVEPGRQHDLLEVLKFLQDSPESTEDRVAWIEFHCVALLDRHSMGRPVFLERQLARDPKFFHQIITYCYRSRDEIDQSPQTKPEDELEQALKQEEDPPSESHGSPPESTEHKRALAMQAYRLLDVWSIPPGSNVEETAIDEESFVTWFEKAKELCEKSGHWEIAQQRIGHCLINEPAGLEGLLKHPRVAKTMDAAACEDMRQGLTTELFNSRGVHGFSAGKDERDLAGKYRGYAARYDKAKFPRIATSLRELAEGYDWDAERETKRDPYR
jgi:hypothetical protein